MKGICPHCSVTVFLATKPTVIGQDIDGIWFMHIARCPNCERFSIELSRQSRADELYAPEHFRAHLPPIKLRAYPRSTQRNPPPQVPEEFTKDYAEAALIIQDSPKSSAALSRRLLQHLLREKAGAHYHNLFDAINHVIDEANLPSHITESLHTLRQLGNFAAHPNKSKNTSEIIEIEHGEAEWCLDVIDALYDHYFVGPAKTQLAKDALNDKHREAGFQPV